MKKISRRAFVATSLTVPFTAFMPASVVAADMPMVDDSDPVAAALGYVAESTTADQSCANCQLYTGEEGAESGPCSLFPGKSVSAKGWCKSWVVKAS